MSYKNCLIKFAFELVKPQPNYFCYLSKNNPMALSHHSTNLWI